MLPPRRGPCGPPWADLRLPAGRSLQPRAQPCMRIRPALTVMSSALPLR